MLKFGLILLVLLPALVIGYFLIDREGNLNQSSPLQISISSPTPSPKPQIQIPTSHIIPQQHHTFQTFNNCGPAAFSMALSYFGINASQQTLGAKLRPYQNPQGDNDDKSVTLDEVAQEAPNYNLIAFHRPNGDIEKLKKFIASDIPVVARTLLVQQDDIGHYRVIRGYDDDTGQLVQDDSLQSANSRYAYSNFLSLWEPYNFEYLVLVPKEKEELAIQILADETDPTLAWQNAHQRLTQQLNENPHDVFAQFNLSNTLYHLGRYQEAIDVFEKVENQLSFRTLWYQIEPILAYEEVGNHQRVFQITDKILNNHNRAFSELYIIRGDIYAQQGNTQAARAEYEKAVFYNQNLQEAKEKLASIS